MGAEMLFFGLGTLIERLLLSAFSGIVSYFKRHKTARNWALGILGVLFLACVILAIPPLSIGHYRLRPYAIFVAVISGLLLLPTLYSYANEDIAALVGKLSSFLVGVQLSQLQDQRRDLEDQRDQQEKEPDAGTQQRLHLFGTSLRLNLNELREYYLINKSQARTSFWVGVLAVILGLGAILVGVGLLFAGASQKHHIAVATLTAVAGLLGQFIGGTCLYMFKKSQDQSTHYYDRLTELQGILLAVRLAETITKEDAADKTRQQIIAALIGKK